VGHVPEQGPALRTDRERVAVAFGSVSGPRWVNAAVFFGWLPVLIAPHFTLRLMPEFRFPA
jgi:hypothetical protein